ncbi:hypothetical protein [Rhodopila globiformis]|uniref:Uncharacterized protein n=1 Tax=Rhodopila globiformis TaxID=1071 RepID=A0A2S6N7H8_RHOGL|nr:hypothetical protein [Rhodopila globiformis]PPQ30582.1 hypothetical protein CCS01_18900 [Rhodopila globiformis]
MAGRKCSICAHSQRREIDSAVMDGCRQYDVARRFKISPDALSRHVRAGHATAASSAAPAPAAPRQLDPLAALLNTQARLVRILDRAERADRGSIFVQAARELRMTIAEIARLTGAVGADGRLVGHMPVGASGDDATRARIMAKLAALAPRSPG